MTLEMRQAGLPPHGRISYSACFSGTPNWGVSRAEEDGWLLENNPCSWGAQDPRYLVLGFSEGVRQCQDILSRDHDDIPAAGFRLRLTRALCALGLLTEQDSIDAHIRSDEPDWAFGSVILCSDNKINGITGKAEKSGTIIAESARRHSGSDWIGTCMSRWLSTLPPRLRPVIMLSNEDAYVDACYKRVRQLHPNTRMINEVAYGDDRVTWVHIVHVGGRGVNHIEDWIAGRDNKQGRKRIKANEEPKKVQSNGIIWRRELKAADDISLNQFVVTVAAV